MKECHNNNDRDIYIVASAGGSPVGREQPWWSESEGSRFSTAEGHIKAPRGNDRGWVGNECVE